MLNQQELTQLYERLGLSQKAQSVIEQIRSSQPSRRVRGMVGNVTVRYPSKKMGLTIQAESHKTELAGIYEMEYDPATLEYYDQPPPIKLKYQSKGGRAISFLYTPDFFVIETQAIGWVEWKTEEELLRLAERMPQRYQLDDLGAWRCPPAEEYASEFGFFFRVCSSAQINWIFQRNLRFLEDYLRMEGPTVITQAYQTIVSQVQAQPGLKLADLLAQYCQDDLYTLIASGQLYVDLRVVPLAEPTQVPVFADQVTAQAYQHTNQSSLKSLPPVSVSLNVANGSAIGWDGQPWTIANLGEQKVSLLSEAGSLVELPKATFTLLVRQGKLISLEPSINSEPGSTLSQLFARASPGELQEANRRYTFIQPLLAGEDAPVLNKNEPGPSARTLRYWISLYRKAQQTYGNGYIGLLPKVQRCGNYQAKLPEKTRQLMQEFIVKDYETAKQKPRHTVYGALVQECCNQGVVAPSYKTFSRAVKARPHYEQLTKRQGSKVAYQAEPWYWELEFTTPRHGDRPFEICHLDHTELDVELVDAQTGRLLGRPWATFLVDAFSRRLLAIQLSFDPPSYRACLLVLRECVQRHNRLPQSVVVDGGHEFESLYFETLLARYVCSKKTRPGAKPRFGSVAERLFGTTNTNFIHNLCGNTQATKAVRQLTRVTNPKEQAIWTLGRLRERLEEWAYQVYDNQPHPTLGQSPGEAFREGLAKSGQRPYRLIPYDEAFLMATLPTTRKGTAKIQPNLGVKINYLYYWSEVFRQPEVEQSQVPVRYDPFDLATAYAFVRGNWVQCISEHFACFKGRSEREVQLASQEWYKRQRQHTQQFTLTARRLAEFLSSVEAEEVLLMQRLRDAATQTQPIERPSISPGLQLFPELPQQASNSKTTSKLVIYEDY